MNGHTTQPAGAKDGLPEDPSVPTTDPVPDDVPTIETADERQAAADKAEHDHDDALADEWGKESFPGSDPPAHY